MNKRAEFNLQGLMIGVIFIALTAGVFAGIFALLGPGYELTDDVSTIDNYNSFTNSNLSADLDAIKDNVDGLSIDANVFDWFSNIWNKLTSPFRLSWKTYKIANNLGKSAISDFKLLPVFQEFLDAAIVILVVIGIVMIKMYLGRQK